MQSVTENNIPWSQSRFIARARALFFARLMFLALGLLILSVPHWSTYFGLGGLFAVAGYLTMLMYSVANYWVIEHPQAGPIVTYVTLCLDLLLMVFLILKPYLGGGLQSPLLATFLLYTMLFAILFPKPLAILPPLMALPLTTRLDILLHQSVTAVEVLTVIWYMGLNLIIVYVIVYLNEREEAAHRQVVELQNNLKERAVNEERGRLSRDIHDGLGASLSSLIIQSEYLLKLASDADDDRMAGELRELKASAEEAIEELRRSLTMMRTDFDLFEALEEYIRNLSDRTQLPIHLKSTGTQQKLSYDTQMTLFRVLQESLSNSAKHAKATDVSVRLDVDASQVVLSVEDNGVGFDPSRVAAGHYGLINMRERARKSDGTVAIESLVPKGTRILLTLPRSHLLAEPNG